MLDEDLDKLEEENKTNSWVTFGLTLAKFWPNVHLQLKFVLLFKIIYSK